MKDWPKVKCTCLEKRGGTRSQDALHITGSCLSGAPAKTSLCCTCRCSREMRAFAWHGALRHSELASPLSRRIQYRVSPSESTLLCEEMKERLFAEPTVRLTCPILRQSPLRLELTAPLRSSNSVTMKLYLFTEMHLVAGFEDYSHCLEAQAITAHSSLSWPGGIYSRPFTLTAFVRVRAL